MIKTLKIKFIAYTIVIFGVIVSVVIGGLYYSVYSEMDNRAYLTLKKTLEKVKIQANEQTYWQTNRMDGLLSFKITQDGQIIGYIYPIEDEQFISDLMPTQQKETSGFLEYEGYILRYLKSSNNDIAYVDVTHELQRVQEILFTSLSIGGLALVVVAISSTMLANWALQPVNENWQKQKQFVSDASHELRTPISVILANTSLLKNNPESTISDKLKWVDYIQLEARRMADLVERLLFLAKNERTEEKLIYRMINLTDLVYETALPLESIAFEQNKLLDIEVEEEVMVIGEPTYLKQLLVILLENAIKYSPENEHITLCLTKQGVLSVKNLGEVIPPDKIKHLFERFYRIDDSRQREKEGYGLGLAIAESIAKRHNTKINVKSTVDGTIFKVDLSKKRNY